MYLYFLEYGDCILVKIMIINFLFNHFVIKDLAIIILIIVFVAFFIFLIQSL